MFHYTIALFLLSSVVLSVVAASAQTSLHEAASLWLVPSTTCAMPPRRRPAMSTIRQAEGRDMVPAKKGLEFRQPQSK